MHPPDTWISRIEPLSHSGAGNPPTLEKLRRDARRDERDARQWNTHP
jgi:hypothetical protein